MLHARAFKAIVLWTLTLLWLGSVVHATEASLACPDWPTCFGTMFPEMTGGVFWEHLHRLVAGALVLLFAAATWLVRKEAPGQRGLFQACVAGLLLLVVQSVFGGLTVLYRLPDLVSTTHLSLAFLFLALATGLAARTHTAPTAEHGGGRRLGSLAAGAAGLVYLQSVVGALVRHTDAGMSCPDVPLCLGQWVPPLVNLQIIAHFTHRVLAVIATAAVLWVTVRALNSDVGQAMRRWALAAGLLILVQVALGVASVLTILAVAPVSLHTLVAACLVSVLVWMAVRLRMSPS